MPSGPVDSTFDRPAHSTTGSEQAKWRQHHAEPAQSRIAAGQLQARQFEPQTNPQNPNARSSASEATQQTSDRGPAAAFDVGVDVQRVTGGESPAPASNGGDVQGAATDNGADRLAAGRDPNAPQADANTLTQELGALGVNAQANTGPAPETGGAPGPEVLGAFDNPGGAPQDTGPNGPAPEPGASTAPGLTGGPDGGTGPPSDLAERPQPGDTVGG